MDPSYVIARFLDPQRIHNLTVYLEALHRQGHATAALTTFLLNCYTKLKDTGRLDRLVFPERYVGGEGEGEEGEEDEEGGERGEGSRPYLPAGLSLLPAEEVEAVGGVEGEQEGGEERQEPEGESLNTAMGRARRRRGGVDVQAAVSILKEAGYLEHALEIARKYR